MSEITLTDAALALNRRETAVSETPAVIGTDQMALLAIGLDVDMREANRLAMARLDAYARACALGVTSWPMAVKSSYLDGVLTGLILAEQRRAAEPAPRCPTCGKVAS